MIRTRTLGAKFGSALRASGAGKLKRAGPPSGARGRERAPLDSALQTLSTLHNPGYTAQALRCVLRCEREARLPVNARADLRNTAMTDVCLGY